MMTIMTMVTMLMVPIANINADDDEPKILTKQLVILWKCYD